MTQKKYFQTYSWGARWKPPNGSECHQILPCILEKKAAILDNCFLTSLYVSSENKFFKSTLWMKQVQQTYSLPQPKRMLKVLLWHSWPRPGTEPCLQNHTWKNGWDECSVQWHSWYSCPSVSAGDSFQNLPTKNQWCSSSLYKMEQYSWPYVSWVLLQVCTT